MAVAVGNVPVTDGVSNRLGVLVKKKVTGVQVGRGGRVLAGAGVGVGRKVLVGKGVLVLGAGGVTMAVCVPKKPAIMVPTE